MSPRPIIAYIFSLLPPQAMRRSRLGRARGGILQNWSWPVRPALCVHRDCASAVSLLAADRLMRVGLQSGFVCDFTSCGFDLIADGKITSSHPHFASASSPSSYLLRDTSRCSARILPSTCDVPAGICSTASFHVATPTADTHTGGLDPTPSTSPASILRLLDRLRFTPLRHSLPL